MQDMIYPMGGVIEYLLSVVGVSFSDIADMTPGQIILIMFGCILGLYVVVFIVRAVLGSAMYHFR